MAEGTVILVTRPVLGAVADADRSFGEEMLDKFLHTLEPLEEKPRAICFYTEGVRAVCEGSPVLMGLQLLQGMGVRLVACGSCLDHYGLRDRLALGEVGGMPDIVGLMMGAARVITV